MTKEEMVHLLKTDVKKWNAWRQQHLNPLHPFAIRLDGVDLRGAQLRDVFLAGVILKNADLSKSDLSKSRMVLAQLDGANLEEANFQDADLKRANFTRANLSATDFRGANLFASTFTGANLRGAYFDSANLSKANLVSTDLDGVNIGNAELSDAKIGYASITNTDLSEVRGLERVKHAGPSSVGVDTIYHSQGKIADSFLRDTGLPEEFIRFIPSLVEAQEGIQFYSCFISYSHRDQEFANRLFSRLRDAKLRVWYAPEDMKGGQKLHEQIETAIRIHDKLLLVLSDASILSDWVKTEVRNAWRFEKSTGKRKLFPVRLTDMMTVREWKHFDGGTNLGAEMCEYYIPDFSEWEDNIRFEAEFKKLLRDLKDEGKTHSIAR